MPPGRVALGRGAGPLERRRLHEPSLTPGVELDDLGGTRLRLGLRCIVHEVEMHLRLLSVGRLACWRKNCRQKHIRMSDDFWNKKGDPLGRPRLAQNGASELAH